MVSGPGCSGSSRAPSGAGISPGVSGSPTGGVVPGVVVGAVPGVPNGTLEEALVSEPGATSAPWFLRGALTRANVLRRCLRATLPQAIPIFHRPAAGRRPTVQ